MWSERQLRKDLSHLRTHRGIVQIFVDELAWYMFTRMTVWIEMVLLCIVFVL